MNGKPSLLSADRAAPLLVVAAALLVCAPSVGAWGRNGNKLIVNQAIDTLPDELRYFFDAGRAILLKHVTDPMDDLAKTPSDSRNDHFYLDKYGRFPFDSIPRDYKAALAKYGKSKLQSNGVLPWQIGVFSQKLTEDMKAGRWDEARIDAALLANYVADAHDPFSTTDNFDGRLTEQRGVNERFGTSLIDRYSSFFPLRPSDAAYISDPTVHAFEVCISSHTWLEPILLADRNAYLAGKSYAYNDEYYDRFYNQAAAILIRQLSEASSDVGSYWMTSWVNAGRPALPH
ncbi:MAG TPA: hypothetical protein VJN93_04440 [Candidatus Acidoferrum sp.]|nr:hypothetical protein [Candidatus Acidoferrum sp.]